jgi:ankyrin repeat protein
MLAASPETAHARMMRAQERFSAELHHQVYEGDSALHLAAAANDTLLVSALLAAGADVSAANRLGAQPLHYAADGRPGSGTWDARAQANVIRILCAAGADANARTKLGVAPLHRAVRTRAALATEELLACGADPKQRNKRGSSAADLAHRTTGKSGSGSPQAKAEQAMIVEILARAARRR